MTKTKTTISLLVAAVFVMGFSAQDAFAANLLIDDSVEDEITLVHDPNWTFGVNSAGTPFGNNVPGITTTPGETVVFSGTYVVNSGGMPDPGEGIIYFTHLDGEVSDIVRASWSTVNSVATITITVDSNPNCENLGPLPEGFTGIAEPTGSVQIGGSFLDPNTGNPVSIPSNLTIQFVSNEDSDCELPQILEELKEIWMFLKEDVFTLLLSIETTVNNIENEVTNPNWGLEEIKREVRIIEEEVTKPTVTTFVDTETIDLDGHLKAGDFKLLMDITPFESVLGHVAMKVPCDKQGNTDLVILTGVAPNVNPLAMNFVAALSNPGTSCLYHGDIGAGDTDVALINTGKAPVNFGPNEEGFSVTITIQGTE